MLIGILQEKYFKEKIIMEINEIEKHLITIYGENVFEEMFNEALERFYEGLILKAISSKYKFGRATLNSGDMYKCKLFLTIDGKIISVRHEKGHYFAAFNLEKSLMNEKNEIVPKLKQK